MLQRALPLQVRPYRRERQLVQRVRQLLAADAECLQTADTLARQLHLSSPSLPRHPKKEAAPRKASKDKGRPERPGARQTGGAQAEPQATLKHGSPPSPVK